MKILLSIFFVLFLAGCGVQQPIKSQSAVVIFKTPNLKVYDKGFITRYDDHIHLQVFNVGHLVFDLKIYDDEVCTGTLQCMSLKDFNAKYLSADYKDDFILNLFKQDKIYFKDKERNILIKVREENE